MKTPKIYLSNGCLVLLCAYCIFDPRGTFLPFLFSVGAHEAGHLLMMRCLHIPVLGLRGSLGGLEILTSPLSYRQEILVALPGPGVNLLLFLLTKKSYPLIALINGVLFLYNMLPVYPLDGGRILRGCLCSFLLPTQAERIERVCAVGIFLGFLTISLHLSFTYRCGLWPILFCAYIFYRLGETILPKRKISLDKIQLP